MKKLILLLFALLPVVSFAQTNQLYQAGEIDLSVTTSSKDYGIFVKPEDAYQTWITIIIDTSAATAFKIEQKVFWGKGVDRDSAWVTAPIYLSSTQEVDTAVTTQQIMGKNASYADIMLWSPFVGDRWRITKVDGTLVDNKVYFRIKNRFWSIR